MKLSVALVHDYLVEFGGAERVLGSLCEMFPDAPIYTAFYRKDSRAYQAFSDRNIIPSFVHHIPGFSSKLHSPLRFLAPYIWESFDFRGFDVVISSASWYITKGIITPPSTLHVCYCHTPPRYLYGYTTSMDWQKSGLIRAYAHLVNPFMRRYDYLSAQRVDTFVANSKEVAARIEKFYRRPSTVIYPPVSLAAVSPQARQPFFLTASRLVGGKGLELAVETATKYSLPLKVVGAGGGWSKQAQTLKTMAGPSVEFVGFVDDQHLSELYHQAQAFITLSQDEDFGITPVEAMQAGTPVIAFNGGGYKETVIDGKTGILLSELTVDSLAEAMNRIGQIAWKHSSIKAHGMSFSAKVFSQQMNALITDQLRSVRHARAS